MKEGVTMRYRTPRPCTWAEKGRFDPPGIAAWAPADPVRRHTSSGQRCGNVPKAGPAVQL